MSLQVSTTLADRVAVATAAAAASSALVSFLQGRAARAVSRAPRIAAFSAMRGAGIAPRPAAAAVAALASVPGAIAPTPTGPTLSPRSGRIALTTDLPPVSLSDHIVLLRTTSPKIIENSVSALAWEAYVSGMTVREYYSLRTFPNGAVFPKGKASVALRFDRERNHVRLVSAIDYAAGIR